MYSDKAQEIAESAVMEMEYQMRHGGSVPDMVPDRMMICTDDGEFVGVVVAFDDYDPGFDVFINTRDGRGGVFATDNFKEHSDLVTIPPEIVEWLDGQGRHAFQTA